MNPSLPPPAPVRRISLLGLVEELKRIHGSMHDRRFCFILGAGASKPSRIPTAGELSRDWLKLLHREQPGTSLDFDKWLHDAAHGIPGIPMGTTTADLSVLAAAYSAVYRAKWSHDPAQGQAEIERHIEAAIPSYGYYALAEILASDNPANPSRHNVVITPNFDNLVAETLAALGKKIPMVIGHSAIARFARPTLSRPVVIKFHHDFLLGPKSDPEEIASMPDGYSRALAEVFRLFTPIVVGYGGNDGSLMGLLEKLPEESIPGGIYWCWRSGSPPEPTVEILLSRQRGTLVEISGFDELMALLEEPFGHPVVPGKLVLRAQERTAELEEAQKRLSSKVGRNLVDSASTVGADGSRSKSANSSSSKESAAILDALNSNPSGEKPGEPGERWWHWQTRIDAARDLAEKEDLFHRGLKATNNSAELLGNFALFWENERKDNDRAEEYYLKAIGAAPADADPLGNFAIFLEKRRGDLDRAEEFYQKAIATDPRHSNNLGNYAIFLEKQRGDLDRAEEFYRRAIEAAPNNPIHLGNFALYLGSQRKDFDRAEELYRRSIEAGPGEANNLGNYAVFLEKYRNDLIHAEEFYRKAVEADPGHANNLANFAGFLSEQGKDLDYAEELYRKAGEINARHPESEAGYAELLLKRGRLAEAGNLLAGAAGDSRILENPAVAQGVLWMAGALEARLGKPDNLVISGAIKGTIRDNSKASAWNYDSLIEWCTHGGTGGESSEFWPALAEVLQGKAASETLEKFSAWRAASPASLEEGLAHVAGMGEAEKA